MSGWKGSEMRDVKGDNELNSAMDDAELTPLSLEVFKILQRMSIEDVRSLVQEIEKRLGDSDDLA